MKTVGYGVLGGASGFVLGFILGLAQCILSCDWLRGGREVSMTAVWACLVIGALIGIGIGLYQDVEDANSRKTAAERARQAEIQRLKKLEIDTVEGIINNIYTNDGGYRNFSLLNQLNSQYRNGQYCKEKINNIISWYYRDASNYFVNQQTQIDMTLFRLKDLLAIPEARNNTSVFYKHQDFFNNAFERTKSIFTDCADISEALLEIRKKFESRYPSGTSQHDIVESELTKYRKSYLDALAAYQRNDYYTALKLSSWSDYDLNSLKDLRELLIFDAMVEAKTDAGLKSSEDISTIYHMYFARIFFIKEHNNDHWAFYPTVDSLAAKAIVYSRGNIVDNINKLLEDYLSVLGNDGLDASQYEALRKIFEYLKAYKQEEKVLNAMFENNVARSPEQKARLAFLKKEILYDYRSVKWSVQETRSYFDALTMNSKVLSMPMVVEEWEQNIALNNIKWKIEEVGKVIKKSLTSNFGDRFQVKYVDTGASTEAGISTEPSIYIYETGASKNNYPWLSFVVTGDQMTMNQVNLAIYALFVPESVELQGTSYSKKNAELCNMLFVLKEKQNPKINRFITTLTNVLVKEIESWFNGNSTVDIYE